MFQSSGGTGAGFYLLPPLAGEEASRQSDADQRSSLRARFRCDHPGYELNSQPAPSTHCKHIFCSKHRTRAGEFCGAALDLRGNHARGCEVGGAILAFHNWARDRLKRTLERWHPGVPVSKEQHVPAWDYQLPPRPDARPGERPPISEARLDIRIPEPSGRGRMINVDIGFADPYTVDLAELRRRAQKPGRAAADYVYHKQQTYPAWRNPTEDLVPFIIAKTAGAAPVRYRTDPPPGPAEAVQNGADVVMPPVEMDAEVARAVWLAQEHGLDWSEQQCRLLLEAVLEYRGGVPDFPQDVVWAEVIDYVPGKDAMASEQLILLLYPLGGG